MFLVLRSKTQETSAHSFKAWQQATEMESRSRLGLGLETSLENRFASLGLGREGLRSRLSLEGYRSRDFQYCKEMVGYSKISIIQRFFVCCICK